jgi:hypothetical protein
VRPNWATAWYPAVAAVVLSRTPGRLWPGSRADEPVDRRWAHHQQTMADLFDAVLAIANDSGHYLQYEAAALVAAAVYAVTSAVAARDGVVKMDSALAAPAGGRLERAQTRSTSGPGR